MSAENSPWVSQMRKGVVEVAILAMLAREQMYGSELVEALASRPGLAISAGTVYPLLSRLKKAGVIDSVWRESPVGPPRKYYMLTKQGQRELGEMADAWRGVASSIDSVLEGVGPNAGR